MDEVLIESESCWRLILLWQAAQTDLYGH